MRLMVGEGLMALNDDVTQSRHIIRRGRTKVVPGHFASDDEILDHGTAGPSGKPDVFRTFPSLGERSGGMRGEQIVGGTRNADLGQLQRGPEANVSAGDPIERAKARQLDD